MRDARRGDMRVDVVIVGGGPAGLSAALVLGRCRRDVIVFDDGRYRNARSRLLNGFLTRDGSDPGELRQIARAELVRYPTVRIRTESITDAHRRDERFIVITSEGEQVESTALLLATGFVDTRPHIAGVAELHGELVVPCPYCDAFEVADQPLAAFSHPDERGAKFALVVANWSRDVVFCASRRPQLGDDMRRRLAARGVHVEERELKAVARDADGVRLHFAEGNSMWRRMMFYHLGGKPASALAEHVGAKIDPVHGVEVTRRQQSSIPGLFVAGDATRDVLQAIVAAGEGSAAAVCINEYLCERTE